MRRLRRTGLLPHQLGMERTQRRILLPFRPHAPQPVDRRLRQRILILPDHPLQHSPQGHSRSARAGKGSPQHRQALFQRRIAVLRRYRRGHRHVAPFGSHAFLLFLQQGTEALQRRGMRGDSRLRRDDSDSRREHQQPRQPELHRRAAISFRRIPLQRHLPHRLLLPHLRRLGMAAHSLFHSRSPVALHPESGRRPSGHERHLSRHQAGADAAAQPHKALRRLQRRDELRPRQRRRAAPGGICRSGIHGRRRQLREDLLQSSGVPRRRRDGRGDRHMVRRHRTG